MTRSSPAAARQFILELFREELRGSGLPPESVPDNFDLLLEGVIDSLGILELLGALEHRFGVTIELENMDPDDVTVIGPLSRYIAARVSSNEADADRQVG